MRQVDKIVLSIVQYVKKYRQDEPIGGQFYSFNADFSPRADDGTPMQLFDWKTGRIDSVIADSWRRYDIALLLKERWPTLGPKLQGKLHIYVGTLDTFRLEGAVELLKEELDSLGSDA